jgi:hypothetical protein
MLSFRYKETKSKGNKMKDYKVSGKFENGERFTVVVTKVTNPFSAMDIARKCKVDGKKIVAMSAFPVR